MSQIKVFSQNIMDISNESASITASSFTGDSGQSIVNYVRNRNNTSRWASTGLVDGDYVELNCLFGDVVELDSIIIIGTNMKNASVRYTDDTNGTVFLTKQANSTDENQVYKRSDGASFFGKAVIVSSLNTNIANQDKYITQLLAVKEKVTFEAYPEIKKPSHSINKKINTMLSGKKNVVKKAGYFSVNLSLEYWNSDDDLSAIEDLYFSRLPYLYWLCGGNEDQFKTKRIGYRMQDIYLMRPTNDYSPEWYKSTYTTGLNLKMSLQEVVN